MIKSLQALHSFLLDYCCLWRQVTNDCLLALFFLAFMDGKLRQSNFYKLNKPRELLDRQLIECGCCLINIFIIYNYHHIMLSAKVPIFRFSSRAIASKTYAKFQEKYAANLESFHKKTSTSSRFSDNIKRTTQKAYVHPYDDLHKKPYYSAMQSLQVGLEFVGAEQVSPHYENFGMARRQALIFWGAYIAMRFIADTPDFHYFADASASAWFFAFSYLYIWTEGKKCFAAPILNRFYRKITAMQMANLDIYYAENVEVRIRNLMSIARQQIDFKSLHNEYMSVRNNVLLNFLINEQILLKNHINERAISILKQVESIESNNQSKIINEVMSETLSSIDKAYSQNKEQIESEMFKLALEGIAKGQMSYEKDPILPYVLKTIQATVDKFSKISPEDQKKMVKLTGEQIEAIRIADQRARDEFLSNEPKVDGSLKNNHVVAKILQRWGK